MLAEITIRDFAIIDKVNLRLSQGMNVLTGETGAGKSILVDALSAVLGERTSSEVVRAGKSAAHIEAFFEIDEDTQVRIEPTLREQGLTGDDPGFLVLSREIRAEGRSIARVNGRVTAAAVVRQLGEMLVDIHGQTEHLSLLRVPEHLNFLDRYAQTIPLRREVSDLVHEISELQAEIRSIREDSRARLRQLERLQYEVEEIAAANLYPEEEAELRLERTRLANSEKLLELASTVYDALYGGSEETPSAADLLGQSVQWLADLERIDATLADARRKVENLSLEAEELGRSLRTYRDSVEYNPERLEEVEERLSLIANLKRKYGSTVLDIIAYRQRAETELAELSGGEERLAELEERQEELVVRLGTLAQQLSQKRQSAAVNLAAAVEEQLRDLAMERSGFRVGFAQTESENGVPVDGRRLAFDRTGIDKVEFMLSSNPSEPLRPLARIASGGENSRLMLALKTVLSQADDTDTLIFDEIDTGIGGRLGHVIGDKLAGLAETHQVLCVTHLPQLAAFAGNHIKVSKQIAGDRTMTVVATLSPGERLQELAAMMGGVTDSTLRSASEMIKRAQRGT